MSSANNRFPEMLPKRRTFGKRDVGGKSRKTDKTWNKDTSQEPGRRKTGTKPICL